MPKIRIEGNQNLTGEIEISGAKNSAVALVPAAILCDEKVKIFNLPNISDVQSLEEILTHLNATIVRNNDVIEIDSSSIINSEIPENISKKLRASYYFMGALLGKFKKVDMYFPGGCSIGKRPINLHLKGFEALGANIIEKDNRYIIEAPNLKGARIYLDVPSVGATINIMLAAVKAEGKTIIENAAKEPEIANVATLLNNMGAKITGAGTSIITINGVNFLHSCFHEVIPDRIEAGTYLIIASLLGRNLTIKRIIPNHLDSLISKLKEAGVEMEIGLDYIKINEPKQCNSINIKTLGYPGFPTDLQQPIIPFLIKCSGTSIVEETIYENRFQNIPDTIKMGASIDIINNMKIKVKGPCQLIGQKVQATDLRAGASFIILGLISEGITEINNIEYILRGYDDIVGKLKKVGAKIEII